MANLLQKELDEKVMIREGEHRREITRREAIIRRLVKDAVDGKASAMRDLLGKVHEIEAAEQEGHAAPEFSQTAQVLLDEVLGSGPIDFWKVA